MPGITDALQASANSMLALERGLAVIQSNVGNASTPGYARQDLVAVDSSSIGGALIQVSSRDEYAEQGPCFLTGQPSSRRVVFARSY